MAHAVLEASLPVGNLDDALPHLRRPFAPEAVKFKVQSVWPGKGKPPEGAIIVAYIDARLAIERLNAVVGSRWSPAYRPTTDVNVMLCDLTVCGVTRPDVGQTSKGISKDLLSDALKRAAVLFGVGVSIYALPELRWPRDQHASHLRERSDGKGGKTLALTEAGFTFLRASYRDYWLPDAGKAFGAVLDHGDVAWDPAEEAQTTDEDEGETPPARPSLDDPEAVAKIAKARAIYTDLVARGSGSGFPEATFVSWLEQAWTSHADLDRLLADLEQRLAKAVAS